MISHAKELMHGKQSRSTQSDTEQSDLAEDWTKKWMRPDIIHWLL